MPHFWMTYRDSGRSVGAVIMEAPSLIQAGLKAIRGVGAGATFAEGHELSADQAALVPAGGQDWPHARDRRSRTAAHQAQGPQTWRRAASPA
jgi:hypothetical protein